MLVVKIVSSSCCDKSTETMCITSRHYKTTAETRKSVSKKCSQKSAKLRDRQTDGQRQTKTERQRQSQGQRQTDRDTERAT